jgi:hypothetical protein
MRDEPWAACVAVRSLSGSSQLRSGGLSTTASLAHSTNQNRMISTDNDATKQVGDSAPGAGLAAQISGATAADLSMALTLLALYGRPLRAK